MNNRIILASQSPRRRSLLGLLGYPFTTAVSAADESLVTDPDPVVNVLQTARLKATTIRARLPATANKAGALLLAADTDVAIDGRILGKPPDSAAARQMLRLLRGRDHTVHTGFVLVNLDSGAEISDVHTAVVTMRDYSDAEIDAYVASGDPLDKAGAYAIQHPQFQPVAHLHGCYMGVMGLSICHLLQVLPQWGVPLLAQEAEVAAAHDNYPCPLFAQYRQQAVSGG